MCLCFIPLLIVDLFGLNHGPNVHGDGLTNNEMALYQLLLEKNKQILQYKETGNIHIHVKDCL